MMRFLHEGLAFGESPRWHDGQLWVCDWGAHELLRFGADGRPELVARVESFPFCIDWLPDGRLLIVSAAQQAVLTLSGEVYADLSGLRPSPGNEIAVDPRGRAYVDGNGVVALVEPSGAARTVADGLAFPNGMAITPDGATLIVAESHASRLTAFDIAADGSLSGRRVWAAVSGSAPDGICLDASGAVWYADVPNRCCVRVREGGEVLERISADRGCFSCALGGRTLYIVAREWHGMADLAAGNGTGQVLAVEVSVGG
jgi:sugar lactone lactonase YvrE